ncbi:MAG: DUF4159 domain-containing protein [Phycisphaerales bacterium]|nr:MAG: DUF4159 domain-containing protein [Phycisphaerales bacterium]
MSRSVDEPIPRRDHCARAWRPLLGLFAVLLLLPTSARAQDASEPIDPGAIGVAHLRPESGRQAECLSSRFLRVLARQTGWAVRESVASVGVLEERLDGYAVAILSQAGAYELTSHELGALRHWLDTGGSLVVTGPCGPGDWLVSAERTIARLYPDQPPADLEHDHPLFHALYDLGPPVQTNGQPGVVRAIERDGRPVLLFSPAGLNDTDGAGGGCCCCGGVELRDAHHLLANFIVLTIWP